MQRKAPAVSNDPDGVRQPIAPVGVEVTDAGTRLIALTGAGATRQRRQERLSHPLGPDDAQMVIAEFAIRALHDTTAADEAAVGQQRLASLAVVIPGLVERASGTVLQADGLPEWTHLALGSQLVGQRFASVTVESAVNAAALAEASLGAGTAFESMFYVSLGRRVSGAWVTDGKVIRGAHDRAGQIGHWRISADGFRCACGAAGHLDPVASAQSIVRNMIGLASGSEESHAAMLAVSHGRAEAMSAAQIFELAREGDAAAEAVTTMAIDGLSVAIANVVAVLDPGGIVIDAPFAGQTERFLDRLRASVGQLTASFAPPTSLVASHFGATGALEGARLIAEQAAWERGHAG